MSQDGEWSGNLIDFYFDVTSRLLRSFSAPFTTDKTGTRHGVGNPVTKAVNEAIANALIHAYYGDRSSVTILLDDDFLTVTNPGSFLVDRDVAIAGGMSEQRNPTLMRIFSFIGVSDRAGSGVQEIFDTWLEQFGKIPCLSEGHAPSVVKIALPLPVGTAVGNKSIQPAVRRGVLDDERLYSFIAASRDGVSSIDVSKAFGVSKRVAQKHLAAIHADPKRNVLRSEATAPYIYYVEGSLSSAN